MPLFVLPFDHRANFAKELLGLPYPHLTSAQKKTVSDYKQIVWEGFLRARSTLSSSRTPPPRRGKRGSSDPAILVDEEFGAAILKDAKRKHIPFALSVEKSGQQLFDFEYGKNFPAHIKKWKPTYVKALVRYNVADTKNNRIQNARLKTLSDFCKKAGIGFMIEPLMAGVGSRFTQLVQTIEEMTAAGIAPTLWKVEAVDTVTQWKQLRALTGVPIIVLGRGDTKAHVEAWIKTAATSGALDGFAVGRTVFLKPLIEYRAKKITKEVALKQIAHNFLHFIKLWKQYGRA